MTLEQLIEEGRRLQRPCVFLRPEGEGPVVGCWYEIDWDVIDEHLMVLTIRGSEPWVEAWHTRAGEFKVIERIT